MKRISKRWVIGGLVIALTIGGVATAQNRTAETKSQSAKKEQTYTVKKQNLQETIALSGEVDAQEKATLRFQTSGRLAWVGVKEGDTVAKYQTLATLDQRDVKKNLEKKLNTYMKSRWDFEQTIDDNEGKIVTDALRRILEKSQFDLNNAVLDVELSDLSVQLSALMTPIEGVVTSIDSPFAGVNITPAQAEFEVVNPTTLILTLLADQTEVTKLVSGMPATIVFDAYPDTTFEGAIATIAFTPKEGETSTVYEVSVTFPSEDALRFRLGMTADATFVLREKSDVLAVPIQYLHEEKGTWYVLLGNKKEKTPVTRGEEIGDMVEITSGLTSGDVIHD